MASINSVGNNPTNSISKQELTTMLVSELLENHKDYVNLYIDDDGALSVSASRNPFGISSFDPDSPYSCSHPVEISPHFMRILNRLSDEFHIKLTYPEMFEVHADIIGFYDNLKSRLIEHYEEALEDSFYWYGEIESLRERLADELRDSMSYHEQDFLDTIGSTEQLEEKVA